MTVDRSRGPANLLVKIEPEEQTKFSVDVKRLGYAGAVRNLGQYSQLDADTVLLISAMMERALKP